MYKVEIKENLRFTRLFINEFLKLHFRLTTSMSDVDFRLPGRKC